MLYATVNPVRRPLLPRHRKANKPALRSRPVAGPSGKAAVVDSVVANVWPMIADGRVRHFIGAELPIEEAAKAHQLLSSGDVHGKVLLRVRD